MSKDYPKARLYGDDARINAAVDSLHEVYDPEVGINIVDLGLIYHIAWEGTHVDVTMTLTTPGCPAGDYIMGGVRTRLSRLDDVESIEVNLVWEPAWSPEAISPEGKEELGWDDE